MARIRLLPETLRNQIAAGEVIERPAAVVKELVENALDAGATRIEVDLLDGGRRLVSVRDDGSGMDREDALLSLERHATSKLQGKDDLFNISSYGFRGEALPSIAAVSRFTLLTTDGDRGTRIEIEGGKTTRTEDAGAPPGTTVEVRDLFWNVPARRKFLKRPPAEQAQCVEAVLRLALPRPDVHFTVRENGRTLVQLGTGDDLERRAEEALGREVRGRLLPFKGECRGIRAHGLAVSPEIEYGSARNVWLFVNQRAVRDRSLTHAVLRAYGELMPHGRYPGAIVFLDVAPAEVDVNVHPAKAEVRLADPRAAWDAIYGGLTPVLSRSSTWLTPEARPYPMSPPPPMPRVAEPPPPRLPLKSTYFHTLRYVGQLHRTYLLCEGPRGLVLIDQHAAHERVNYQRLRKRAEPSQPLLVPHVVELTATAAEKIAAAKDDLAALGIELDRFGLQAIAVKSLPRALEKANLAALLTDLVEDANLLQDRRDALAARAACHASVRAHDALVPAEAQALLDALDETDYGARCAHGRPVVAEFNTSEIEKRFGRDYETHAHAAPPEIL